MCVVLRCFFSRFILSLLETGVCTFVECVQGNLRGRGRTFALCPRYHPAGRDCSPSTAAGATRLRMASSSANMSLNELRCRAGRNGSASCSSRTRAPTAASFAALRRGRPRDALWVRGLGADWQQQHSALGSLPLPLRGRRTGGRCCRRRPRPQPPQARQSSRRRVPASAGQSGATRSRRAQTAQSRRHRLGGRCAPPASAAAGRNAQAATSAGGWRSVKRVVCESAGAQGKGEGLGQREGACSCSEPCGGASP